MAEDKPHELLIIRRVRDHGDGGHGGAWKIAFADFMTAMMALFLVLWLISATNEKTKASLARYFNPVKLVDMTVQKRGLHDPQERAPEDVIPDRPQNEKHPGKPISNETGPKHDKESGSGGPAEFQPTHSEAALFRDPYAVLAEIAGTGSSVNPSDKIEHPNVGAAANFQDPFQAGAPVLPQQTPSPPPQPQQSGSDQLGLGAGSDTGAANSSVSDQDAANLSTSDQNPAKPADQYGAAPSGAAQNQAALIAAQNPAKSDANSNGAKNQAASSDGAKQNPAKIAATQPNASDTTKSEMVQADSTKSDTANTNVADTDAANTNAATKTDANQQKMAQTTANPAKQPSAEELKLARLQNELKGMLGDAAPAPGIQVKPTPQGIVISLTDGFNYAMFAIGSAEPAPRTVQIMAKVAQFLEKEKGDIVISGHTDGRRYKSRNYDNWRLSEARAQMALYMLVRGGLQENRIIKIEGAADHELKVPTDPMAAENRRIEILLREGHL
ncbi:MAG: flagellar motor protein MotB [Methylovirgula sp.]